MTLTDYSINYASAAPTRKPVNQSIVQIIWLVPYEGNTCDNGVKANVKQNEANELVVRSTYFQSLKCNVKNSSNFGGHSIWLDIIS